MSGVRRSRRATVPNPSGAHRLTDPAARRLVRAAGVTSDDLVLDLGAGLGAVTRPLAATGARVIAVERDPRIAAKLEARMAASPQVTVVANDALTVPLPHRPFKAVANIPFSITTPLLRRLVDSRLAAADLVVELGAGRRLVATALAPGPTAARGRQREVAGWHRRFEFSLGPVIPAHRFTPAPPVDAVVLRLRRRPPTPRGRS
ncbi:rRNA adenine N(6)-methyltransferase family protein [Natronosporangium hydrolyticum]|uniref:rRNA adenine N(6)-methyltransferase family protein n=1 Tax=Natronosporangium hydrolyticum TaxID=2811111 RepID=A0A895YLW2_9ACTN|nr:rRNA adenine N(6)-methyltransferase family protein [Natronosporangium hydrolyticum]QSB16962.1 rRNA adenine N(6)-methyltransferase family protein [Natronosporangium hydrolyticum]